MGQFAVECRTLNLSRSKSGTQIMANQTDMNNKHHGILGRIRRSKWWRRLTRTALILLVVAGLLIVFASNRFCYLSQQRFGNWSRIQWKYQSASDVKISDLQVIGHRGSGIESTDSEAKFENKLIGNTASSIHAAINKSNWIEIDIRESKDGELIVFHDSNVVAKTDFELKKSLLNCSTGEVSGLTLAQLKSLSLKVESNEQILTLDEVFAMFPAHEIRWIFDIKENGISQKVLDWLQEKKIPNQLILFGDFEVLEDFQDSGYPLGYTTLFGKSWQIVLFNPSQMFDRCDEIGCELLVVPIFFVTQTFVDSANKRGIEVWCYDSNDKRDLEYAKGCGVKGVIVDNPQEVFDGTGEEIGSSVR